MLTPILQFLQPPMLLLCDPLVDPQPGVLKSMRHIPLVLERAVGVF